MRAHTLFFLPLILLTACAGTATTANVDPVAPKACSVDADCTVKDVGSCCGHYPQCVNVAHRPDPDAVKAACAREGRSSVCGFPEIQGCRCIAGQCAASDAAPN